MEWFRAFQKDLFQGLLIAISLPLGVSYGQWLQSYEAESWESVSQHITLNWKINWVDYISEILV